MSWIQHAWRLLFVRLYYNMYKYRSTCLSQNVTWLVIMCVCRCRRSTTGTSCSNRRCAARGARATRRWGAWCASPTTCCSTAAGCATHSSRTSSRRGSCSPPCTPRTPHIRRPRPPIRNRLTASCPRSLARPPRRRCRRCSAPRPHLVGCRRIRVSSYTISRPTRTSITYLQVSNTYSCNIHVANTLLQYRLSNILYI